MTACLAGLLADLCAARCCLTVPPGCRACGLVCVLRDQAATAAKLEAETKRLERQDELERQRAAERLRMEEESHARREEKRLEAEMKLQQGSIEAQKEVAIARAQAEMEGKIRQERENEDIAIRRMQLQAEQEKSKVCGWWRWLDPSRAALTAFGVALRSQMREAIEVALAGIGAGFQAFLASGQVVEVVGIIFAVFLSLYIAREGVRFIIGEVQRRIGQPSLVRESSHSNRGWICFRCCRKSKVDAFTDVVMSAKLETRITKMATSTR